MNKDLLISNLRTVPDYPVKGILFFDVTTMFKNRKCFEEIVNSIYDLYKDKGITKVAGIESRGFVVGAAVAAKLGVGFVPVRKPGKLPSGVVFQRIRRRQDRDAYRRYRAG